MNTAYVIIGELINHDTIKLKEAVPFEDGEIRVVVELKEKVPESRKRAFGSLKGKITMRDDFNEPLEDFKEYM